MPKKTPFSEVLLILHSNTYKTNLAPSLQNPDFS